KREREQIDGAGEGGGSEQAQEIIIEFLDLDHDPECGYEEHRFDGKMNQRIAEERSHISNAVYSVLQAQSLRSVGRFRLDLVLNSAPLSQPLLCHPSRGRTNPPRTSRFGTGGHELNPKGSPSLPGLAKSECFTVANGSDKYLE